MKFRPGSMLPVVAIFALMFSLPAIALLAPPAHAVTFTYTDAEQSYTVPSGFCQVEVDAYGGQGGCGTTFDNMMNTICADGGLGGRAQALIDVTPGETLYIYVGDIGKSGIDGTGSGYNGGGSSVMVSGYAGGGGGGGSDLRQGGNGIANRVVVAGGGGGTGFGPPGSIGSGGVGGGGNGGSVSGGGIGGSGGSNGIGGSGGGGTGGSGSTGGD